MKLVLHECPTCGANKGEPCRTPSGRKRKNGRFNTIHDTRPFSIVGDAPAGQVPPQMPQIPRIKQISL